MEIKFFDNSLEKFIVSLEDSTIAKILHTIDLLEMFGHKLGLPHSKRISKNIFELRIYGTQKVRVFYTIHKTQAILLYGFVKKTQKIPQKEIKIVEKKIKAINK